MKLRLALLVPLLFAPQAPAAVFTLTPTVVGRFDEAFNPVALDLPAAGPIVSGAGLYQIDFHFTISDLAPGEVGYANSLFDVALTGFQSGGADARWNPYCAEITSFASGASASAPPHYYVNVDAGADTTDLQRIVTSIAPDLSASDPRANLGKDTPSLLGSIYVPWDGVTYSTLATRSITFSTSSEEGAFTVAPGTAAGAVVEFGTPGPGVERVAPEPAWLPPPVPDPPIEEPLPPITDIPIDEPPPQPPVVVFPVQPVDPPVAEPLPEQLPIVDINLPPPPVDPSADDVPSITETLPTYFPLRGIYEGWIDIGRTFPIDEAFYSLPYEGHWLQTQTDLWHSRSIDDSTNLVPIMVDRQAIPLSYGALTMTTAGHVSAWHVQLAGLQLHAAAPGVPEPTTALLAVVALASLTSSANIRPKR